MSNLVWTRRSPFAEFDALVRQSFGPATSWPTPVSSLQRTWSRTVTTPWCASIYLALTSERTSRSRWSVARWWYPASVATSAPSRPKVARCGRSGTARSAAPSPCPHVTGDAISASYDAGILTVKVAGAYANAAAQKIEITT